MSLFGSLFSGVSGLNAQSRAMGMISDDVRERLLREPEVERVEVEMVWHPAWTSKRVSGAGRERLRAVGIAL